MNDLNENKDLEKETKEEALSEENNENEVSEENADTEANESVALDEEQKEEDALPEMTPIVEVETTYDYKVLKYCNMYVIKVKRKSLLINLIMAIVFIIISGVILYTSLINLDNGNKNYIYAIITFLLSVWVIISIFTEERRIDKSLVNYFRTHSPIKQKFSFDKEKIRITAVINGEERQADYPWAYVTEIHAIPEYFFLFINGGSPIVIDRNPESVINGTMEDLENLIREEGSLKPFKVYTKPLVKHLANVTYPTPVIDLEEKEEKLTEENKEETEEDKNE